MGSPPAAAAASIARPPVHATRNSCRHSYIKFSPLTNESAPAKAGRSHCLQGAGKRGIEKTAKVYNF